MCKENGVLRGFKGSFQNVSTKFQKCLKKVLYGMYFKKVSRMFQGRLKGVSREISVSFKSSMGV